MFRDKRRERRHFTGNSLSSLERCLQQRHFLRCLTLLVTILHCRCKSHVDGVYVLLTGVCAFRHLLLTNLTHVMRVYTCARGCVVRRAGLVARLRYCLFSLHWNLLFVDTKSARGYRCKRQDFEKKWSEPTRAEVLSFYACEHTTELCLGINA